MNFFRLGFLVFAALLTACASPEKVAPAPEIRAETSVAVPENILEKFKTTEQNFTAYKNIPYEKKISENVLIDVFLPDKNVFPGKSPVILWIHGGGFRQGDKGKITEKIPLLKNGFAVAAINYRLLDEAAWPAQIHDAKTAVRFLRAGAKVFEIDSEKIGALGFSAGGNLAALLGTTAGVEIFEGKNLGFPNFSSEVVAVADLYGSAGFAEQKIACRKNTLRCGAIEFVGKNNAAFLLIHGDLDKIVPVEESQEFHKKLTAAGADSKLIVAKNRGHGDGILENYAAEILEFFEKKLKN
ncbi:alpha/beta hydrolase [bacterium]|nr:alpha/beta hydrolase [bacterium]MBT6831700.1 alpha/beta hydrolase [bacterium]MBT6996680.1 alpha/beta hydrolase [bacterium]MBT7772849.1 alpha/beta hydrolase [bacterium]